jgi:hypothetical protein
MPQRTRVSLFILVVLATSLYAGFFSRGASAWPLLDYDMYATPADPTDVKEEFQPVAFARDASGEVEIDMCLEDFVRPYACDEFKKAVWTFLRAHERDHVRVALAEIYRNNEARLREKYPTLVAGRWRLYDVTWRIAPPPRETRVALRRYTLVEAAPE